MGFPLENWREDEVKLLMWEGCGEVEDNVWDLSGKYVYFSPYISHFFSVHHRESSTYIFTFHTFQIPQFGQKKIVNDNNQWQPATRNCGGSNSNNSSCCCCKMLSIWVDEVSKKRKRHNSKAGCSPPHFCLELLTDRSGSEIRRPARMVKGRVS